MNPFKRFSEKLLLKSQQAILQNRPTDARRIARKALILNESLEEAWLILAATSDPEESIGYIKRVLQLNSKNEKAFKGLAWAKAKMEEGPARLINLSSIETKVLALIDQNKIPRNNLRSFFKQISSRWQTISAIIGVVLIVLVAAAAPLLAPSVNPGSTPWFRIVCERYNCIPEPPSSFSPLGTVKEFDMYHTLIWGVRQSLIFGLLTASITALLGTSLGLVSAYYGGWLDRFTMRICDAFLAFPIVAGVALFAQASILIAASDPNSSSNLITVSKEVPNLFQTLLMKADPILIALILFSWMGYTRIVHSQVLQIKKEEYIKAAHASGARHFRIIFKHILPNSITPSIVMATRDVGRMVVIQSSLTFIGVGSSSAWATLLNLGKDWIIGPGGNLLTRWWIYLPITLALVFFGVTWGIMGDELNHWMNPKNI